MATLNTTPTAVLDARCEPAKVVSAVAPPQLLRCLIVSLSADRRRLIRTAAEAQAWDAIICRDAGEFLRVAYKRSVPLMVVDLPEHCTPDYWGLRHAADDAKQISQSLLFIAGAGAEADEEIWARSLGAWAYLSEVHSQRGFELVLADAKEVVSKEGRYTSRQAGRLAWE